ncbi:MAG: LLM class F420-dependent oxidoreductase [Gammaproteobacteria bacterium]
MHLGIVSYNTEYGIRPDDCAREAEARGFESVWFPEHTHIPVNRATPFPLGGELPEQYKHFMNIFVSMTAAAAATSTIKVGAGVCLLIQHDPIVAAKAVATIDYLSGGRVLFGVGGGWNVEEMANHGTAFADRWKVLRERVAAMRKLWTEEEASFHGEFVDFDPVWCYPKPVQRPHPPVYLGAVTKAGLKRVVEWCDGWLLVDPMDGSLERAAAELRELCLTRERDPASISVTVFATRALDAALLDRYAAAGVERVINFLPPESADTALQAMDAAASFIGRHD